MEDPVRLGLSLAMLLGASISDLRTRRVPNPYWWPWLLAAVTLIIGDLVANPAEAWIGLLWSLGTAGLLYGLWYFHMFGGADAKGLMVLAAFWPTTPQILDGATTHTLDALVNASAMVAILPLIFLIWNLARGHIGGPMLLGVRMRLEHAKSRHVWPMERVVDGQVRVKLWQKIGVPQDQTYRDLEQAGVDRVWATPKIPFMLGIFAGLILASQYGNLLLKIMTQLLG